MSTRHVILYHQCLNVQKLHWLNIFCYWRGTFWRPPLTKWRWNCLLGCRWVKLITYQLESRLDIKFVLDFSHYKMLWKLSIQSLCPVVSKLNNCQRDNRNHPVAANTELVYSGSFLCVLLRGKNHPSASCGGIHIEKKAERIGKWKRTQCAMREPVADTSNWVSDLISQLSVKM